MFSKHLLAFTSWIFPETHFSTSFKTISVYLACKQVELASVHYELCKIHSLHQDANSTDQQNNCQNVFMEIDFTGTWTYPVRLPIPSMQLLRPVFRYKADNCNYVLKLLSCSFVLSSRNRAQVDQMSGTDVARRSHPI